MKLNEDYVLRTIAGEKVVVPTGDASQQFNGLMTLNDAAAFLWEHVEKVETKDELVQLVLEEYEVSEERASYDVERFLTALKEVGILQES